MNRNSWLLIGAAILIGIGLRFVVNLEPEWWLAWFVPGLLLALSLRASNWVSRGLIALAAAIGLSANYSYLTKVMPLTATLTVLALQVLLWLFIIGASRRVVLAFQSGWTVLALPVIGVAADTLLAHFTPDGNWGSLAYTQADVLPIAQLASVAGTGGILFVLLLVNSAIALGVHFQMRLRGAEWAYSGAVGVFVLSALLGLWRLQAPEPAKTLNFGIASIDDFLADANSLKSDDVWLQYTAQISALAAGGARVILLPEKINVLPANLVEPLKAHLANLARQHKIWLIAGLGVIAGKEKRNEGWWFGPDGNLVTNYLKHYMAPPEREFVAGHEFPVSPIEGVNHGVAICKDMHFASLGRGFGARDAAVMLVPAWDFHDDAWMAANMTKLRGVENGFTVVRAARDGLLSVSDPYGRMLVVAESRAMPGASLFARVNVGPRIPTLYTRIGDVLGWLCVAAMVALLIGGVRHRFRGMGSDPIS